MPKHKNRDGTVDLHGVQMLPTVMISSSPKDESGQILKGCTGQLKMGLFHKEERKKKRSFLDYWNTESVLPESQVSYEEETMEKGETVLPSRNIDELQALSDGGCTPKKHKKNKRHKKEFHSTQENQNGSVSQCGEELETTEEGALCTVKKLPSEGQEQAEGQELYETLLTEADDVDTELPSQLKEVGIPFSRIIY
jgi:hypothetical protein